MSERIPFKNEEGWSQTYQDVGALRLHDERAEEALVHIGKREKTTFDGSLLANDHSLMRMSAIDLIIKCLDAGMAIHTITRVVGDLPLADFMASEVGYHKNRSSSPRETTGACKSLSFEDAVQVQQGETILVVETSFTTGRRSKLIGEIAERVGATMLPYVLTLVNLSDKEEVSGMAVISLVRTATTSVG